MAVTLNLTNNIANTTASFPDEVTKREQFTGTVTANDGYKFTDAPKFEYQGSFGDEYTETAVLSDDGKTATFTITISDMGSKKVTAYLTGSVTADASAETITVTTDLVGCTSDAPETIKSDETLAVTLTASDNYQFSGDVPNIIYYDGDGVKRYIDFTVSDDKQSATVNIDLSTLTLTSDKGILITAAAEIIGSAVAITNDIENCATYGIPESALTTDTLDITCTANENYTFVSAPYMSYTDSEGEVHEVTMTITDDGTTATLTVDLSSYDIDTDKGIEFSGSATAYKNIVTLNNNVTNAVGSHSPSPFTTSDMVNITLTANENYSFQDTPKLTYQDEYGGEIEHSFTVSDDKQTASIKFDCSVLTSKLVIELIGTAAPTTEYIDKYGSINVYNVTVDNLKEFASKRFKTESSTYFVWNIDLGDYVDRIHRVFCKIGDTIASNIRCATYDTGISASTPINTYINLNFGDIVIPTHNQNITDYQTEITIFLPFVGLQQLDSKLTGRTINLQYDVNIVTGEGVAKLMTDGIVFALYECDVKQDVIYRTGDGTEYIGKKQFESKILYGLTPYVYIRWYQSKNNKQYNNECERVVIGQKIGYSVFTEVTDISDDQMTTNEKDMIYELLNKGVYVEENS